jgi:hypothetical protein
MIYLVDHDDVEEMHDKNQISLFDEASIEHRLHDCDQEDTDEDDDEDEEEEDYENENPIRNSSLDEDNHIHYGGKSLVVANRNNLDRDSMVIMGGNRGGKKQCIISSLFSKSNDNNNNPMNIVSDCEEEDDQNLEAVP